jgi:adenylate cyclase
MQPYLLAAFGLLAAGLAALWWQGRRRIRLLERRLRTATSSLEQLQQSFARFAPAQVVEEIAARGVSTGSEKKEVTVLFADLRGFTPMSESMYPATLVDILNGYLARMSRAIAQHHGHVSLFIGDGIMALFGALEPNPWQTGDAARAALAMRQALAEYNAALAERGHAPLKFGVGIHRGVAVEGVIGAADLQQYTVIGNTVNLASRVQTLTRDHGVDILLSEEARRDLDPRFPVQEMPALPVKGISNPVTTFALGDFKE